MATTTMVVLLMLGALLLIWLLSLLILLWCSPPPRPLRSAHAHANKKENVLLVIAHPDDESMFFAPTLLSLASLGCYHVWILCFSNGNAEGLGAIRKQEMLSACSFLKVPMENVEVLDDPALQDGHNVIWSQDLISQILKRTLSTHSIDTIITFDKYGVSGHPNHSAVYRGVCAFLLNCAKDSGDQNSLNIEAWKLESVNITEKYVGPVCALCSMWSRNTTQIHHFYNIDPWQSIAAMRQHATQWLWYRRLFVIFSHYTYMNTLHKIDF